MPSRSRPSASEISLESSVRERRSHAAYPVTGSPGALHPIGQPIACSKNRGLEIRPLVKEPVPGLKLTRTGGEERGIVTGRQPSARMASHSVDQLRAALVSEICPELVSTV